jgi:hypothetical protein
MNRPALQICRHPCRAWIVYVVCVTCVLLSAEAQGAPKKNTRAPVTIFESFRALDGNLVRLDAQLKELEDLIARGSSGARATSSGRKAKQPWTAPSQRMLKTVSAMQGTTLELQRRHTKSTADRELLAPLTKESSELVRAARNLTGASTPEDAQKSLAQIRDDRIRFNLRFQAIAADYGALRCARGQWSCCEITAKNGERACHWACVSTPRQCKAGLVGGRSQSATANVIKH